MSQPSNQKGPRFALLAMALGFGLQEYEPLGMFSPELKN